MPKSSLPAAANTSTLKRRVAERRQADRRRSVQASDEATAARQRSQQFAAVMRARPHGAALTLLNVALVVLGSQRILDNAWVLAWTSAVLLLTLFQLQAWRQWRGARSTHPVPPHQIHLMIAHAATMGLLWGAVPLLMLGNASAEQRSLLLLCSGGMLCAGALTLAALPPAAWAYMGTLTGGAMLAFALRPEPVYALGALQWLALSGVAVVCGLGIAQTLRARVAAEVKSEHQNQLIGLLLRDFADQGSDVIWEIDATGRFTSVSSQLAAALACTEEHLRSRTLLGILGDLQKGLPDNERDSADALRDRLTEGQPFRDVLVPMMVHGKQRWWSITAKPLVNEHGGSLGWRGVARDVTQARLADKRLSWLAHFDTLTGLSNRAYFRILLDKALLHARQNKDTAGAVMCLDLDGFKNVNDTLGHATGDALLVEVARRLRQAVGQGRGNVVARLGGDEFAVLVRSARTEPEITALAQHIVEAMRPPCSALGAEIPVRASIGIARYPQDGLTVDEMMQHADLALYDAKAHAPGSMRFFVQRLGEQVRRRLVLERDLREAMQRGQLKLHFQPKVDLLRWQVIGFEALLRWEHPQHGNIPPVEFIPVAEEAGLILAIGEWALKEACLHAARWPEPLQVAVNISPVQVMAQNLPDAVRAALQGSGLAPHRLELEITESVFINETRGTVGRLHALRRLGVAIALDDFGTGYSSLAYLRRFPFDTLKIDRAFVRELLVSRDARAIVRNILALAKALRMTTVAEGVEEPAQVKVLELEGCDLVQGYFVARPLPADEVVAFAQNWGERQRSSVPQSITLGQTRVAEFMTQMPESLA